MYALRILGTLTVVVKLKHLTVGGDERDRTADPMLARQVLSQLSYAPTFLLLSAKTCLVGLSGLEPLTSRLSGVRSNQLSYRPLSFEAGNENRTRD